MSETSMRPRMVAGWLTAVVVCATLFVATPRASAATTIVNAGDGITVTVKTDGAVAEKGWIDAAIAAAKWLAGKAGLGGDSGGGGKGGSNDTCNVNVNITVGGSGAPPQNVQVNVGNATCGKNNNGGDSNSGNKQ